MTAVTVPELQRAWQAIRQGQFADLPSSSSRRNVAGQWYPAEPVLPVLGAHGQSGASTVALALATRAAPARVVECASAHASGLVAAPTAELGRCTQMWTRGQRNEVLVDRCSDILFGSTDVPLPTGITHPVTRTVLDVAWDATHVLSQKSWLSALLLDASCVVVTSVASVPALRRMETTLGLLPDPSRVVAAIVGPPAKRWPRALTGSLGPVTRRLLCARQVVAVPVETGLKITGVTPEPLPQPLLTAAGEILRITEAMPTHSKKDES